jgi:hypothetical protein
MKRSPLARGSKGLTRSGFVRQQSALARATGLHPAGNGLSRGKPLAQVSERRKVENAPDGTWTALKRRVKDRDRDPVTGLPICRAAALWPEVTCGGGMYDPHHVHPTGAGGPRICADEDLIVLCRAHHDAVHLWTRKARERGLLR